MSLTLRAFSCGWFQSPVSFFLEGGEQSLLRCPIPAYFIDHPKGRVVFDTGLGERLRQPIAKRLAPDEQGYEFDASADIAAQLRSINVDPASISWIINSHFHADHCGGNALLPNATVIVQGRERTAARDFDGKGMLLYDPLDYDTGQPVLTIDGEHDLFGDGTIVIFPSYGHTPGHQSARVRLDGGEVILAADCCYLERSLDELRPSGNDKDREASFATLRYLAKQRERGTHILFGHDGRQWKTIVESDRIV